MYNFFPFITQIYYILLCTGSRRRATGQKTVSVLRTEEFSSPTDSVPVGNAPVVFKTDVPSTDALGSYLPPALDAPNSGSTFQGPSGPDFSSNSNIRGDGIGGVDFHLGVASDGGSSGQRGHNSLEKFESTFSRDSNFEGGSEQSFGIPPTNGGGIIATSQFEGGSEQSFGIPPINGGETFPGPQFEGGSEQSFGIPHINGGEIIPGPQFEGGSEQSFGIPPINEGERIGDSLPVSQLEGGNFFGSSRDSFDVRGSFGESNTGFSSQISPDAGNVGFQEGDKFGFHGNNQGSEPSLFGIGENNERSDHLLGGDKEQHGLTSGSSFDIDNENGHLFSSSGPHRFEEHHEEFSGVKGRPRFSGRKGGYGGSRRSSCEYSIEHKVLITPVNKSNI